jgi:hypothetical protein
MEKGKLGGTKGKRERPRTGFELEFHLATRPRARTNETKRFPGRSHPPTSDDKYIHGTGSIWVHFVIILGSQWIHFGKQTQNVCWVAFRQP